MGRGEERSNRSTGDSSARRATRRSALAVWLAALVLATGQAGAQTLVDEGKRRDETIAFRERLKDWDNIKQYGAERVGDRDRQPFKPDGIRAGNYLVFPSLGATVLFDDNIYATNTARTSDVITRIEPTVQFQSHLPRHMLDFGFGLKATQYADHDEFNTLGGFGNMNGALHFDHAHTLAVSLLSEYDHEERLAPEAPLNAAEKVPIWHSRASVGIKRDAGRLWASLGVTAETWNYYSVKARDGSTIEQDGRDTEVYSTTLKSGYRFSPATSVETKLRALRQLNDTLDKTGRSGNGYEALVGLASEVNPLLRWRILGGYAVRDYDNAALGDIARTIAEAEVQWLATQTLTLYATLRRSLEDEDAVLGGGGSTGSALGRTDTSLRARAEYEAWRNLLFTLEGEYRESDFIGSSRRDRTAIGRVGIEYHHTKNWLFSAGYERVERESTDQDFDLSRNRVWLGMKLRF